MELNVVEDPMLEVRLMEEGNWKRFLMGLELVDVV